MELNEADERAGQMPVVGVRRHVTFNELEHAIMKFSGDDRSFSVHDFLAQLEQVLDQVGADDILRTLALRNSLTGTARLLLSRAALT